MWKSIVLCISLFGGAALGLSAGSRFVEPAALPAAAAIGLCLIGVVLILAAPAAEAEAKGAATADERGGEAAVSGAATISEVEPVELPPLAATSKHVPTLPLEAINS